MSLSLGSVAIPPGKSLHLAARLITGDTGREPALETILFSVRLPRILLASLVGAALALAGAVFQSLLRNPLADPYVLGVSTGASMGTIVYIILAASAGIQVTGSLCTVRTSGGRFCGRGPDGGSGLLRRRKIRPQGRKLAAALLLAGIVMASFISSINVFLLTSTSQADLRGIFYWLIGDLSRPVDASIYVISPLVAVGALPSVPAVAEPEPDLLGGRGRADAGRGGAEGQVARLLLASLVTGSVVSISGPIAYIGLICPHLARMALGGDNRILFPSVFVFGAIFTLLADTVARTVVAPAELPVGVITALCGAPLFIYLLRRKGGGW